MPGGKLSREELIKNLNYDLAGELQAIIQYLQHSYHMVGLIREPIVDALRDISKDEMEHAEHLSERIAALGGIPAIQPRPIKQPETIREMLEANLQGEAKALVDYAKRRDECEKMGEVGTALIIEDIIVDEQHHYDRLTMLLREEKGKSP